jgi:hypothetical protein
MNVNWDEALHDAENSPRSTLLDAMEVVDDSRTAVVILLKRDSAGADEVWYQTAGSAFEVAGLMQWVQRHIVEMVE